MATKQFSGDALASNLAGLSKSQLYEIMSQMKTLIEQNPEQARQILIQNPPLTRALFQAQIMLGMVQPSQPIQNIPPKSSQQIPPSVQPTTIHGPQSLSVQGTMHDPTNVAQPQNPLRRQQINQAPGLIPGVHTQPLASQQHRSHLNAQPSEMQSLSHLQPPLPSVSASHLPLQPPLTQARPNSGPPSHQYQPGLPPNLNYQHPGPQQMHHLQPPYNSNMKPPNSNVMGPPFPHGQPPFPNQHPPSQYQVGNPHLGAEFNNRGGGGSQLPGSQWQGVPPGGGGGSQLPGPPPQPQPGLANPISPDLEQMLQQVMSLPIEQINELPPEQRNQVLQLRQMFHNQNR